MPDLGFSLTSWGNQNASKRVLLLHGLQGTGAVWFKVAEKLVQEGYRVDAPDLLGHGWAPHRPPYTASTFAQYLADNLRDPYDLVAGVSWGSSIAALLFSLLQHKPDRLLLVEPVVGIKEMAGQVEKILDTLQHPPSEETILERFPTWTRTEAVLRRLSLTQLDPEMIIQAHESRANGDFEHDRLLPSQASAEGSEVIILAADPELGSIYPVSNAIFLEERYPFVKLAQRKGASHDMHKDKPEVLVGVLLDGLKNASSLGVNVIRG